MKKTLIMTIAVLGILLAGIIGIVAANSEPARREKAQKEQQKESETEIREQEQAEVTEPKEEVSAIVENDTAKELEKETAENEAAEQEAIKEESEENKKDDSEEENAVAESKNEEVQEPQEEANVNVQAEPKEELDDVVNEEEQEAAKEAEKVILPYKIPGTDLVVEKIEPFNGIFLEDGSDVAVSNVTTMLLKNKGTSEIEFAAISIKCDEQELLFDVSVLPAGASVIVQEKNMTEYKQGTYHECKAEAAQVESLEMSENKVKVTEKENDSLEVTNLTNETISTVRIFYKYYMEEENVYVGGITYTAKIDNLEKGSSQLVTPKHYLDGSSQVVMIRTYEN